MSFLNPFSFKFWLVTLAFLPALAWAQYPLPELPLLQEKGIKSLRIFQKALRYEGGPIDKRRQFEVDSSTTLNQEFYFSPEGRVDSIFLRPWKEGYYRKFVYRYREGKMIGETIYEYNVGLSISWRLDSNDLGGQTLTVNNKGSVSSETITNRYGVVVESLHYGRQDSDSLWQRRITFDPIENIREELWRGSKGAFQLDRYQWFADSTGPVSFKHQREELESGQKEVDYQEKTYALDSAGNVVNKYLGRFDDPYLYYNYFDRIERIPPRTFYEQARFRSDTMIHQWEQSHLITFSGIQLRHRYTVEYQFYD